LKEDRPLYNGICPECSLLSQSMKDGIYKHETKPIPPKPRTVNVNINEAFQRIFKTSKKTFDYLADK
jgi:hypothetical protein